MEIRDSETFSTTSACRPPKKQACKVDSGILEEWKKDFLLFFEKEKLSLYPLSIHNKQQHKLLNKQEYKLPSKKPVLSQWQDLKLMFAGSHAPKRILF